MLTNGRQVSGWIISICIAILAWLLIPKSSHRLGAFSPLSPSKSSKFENSPLQFPHVLWKPVASKDLGNVGTLSEHQYMKQMLQNGQPVLLRNLAPLKEWAAFEQWSIHRVLRDGLGPRLGPVLHQSTLDREFVYYDLSKPLLAHQPGAVWRAPSQVEEQVDTEQFLQQVFFTKEVPNPQNLSIPDEYWYFSAKLTDFPALLASVSPFKSFVSPLLPTGYDSGFVRPNLWISSSNVSARCHYDAENNLFVQIRGRKRMILFPTNVWPHLSSFPHSHPVARHSRIDFRAASLLPAEFLSLGAVLNQGWEVVLEPGDVLFLPSFWWHFVESLSPSISVNFYVPTLDKQAFIQVIQTVAHATELSTAEDFFLFTQVLVTRLVQRRPRAFHLAFPACQDAQPSSSAEASASVSTATRCLVEAVMRRFSHRWDPFLQGMDSDIGPHNPRNRFCKFQGSPGLEIPRSVLQLVMQVEDLFSNMRPDVEWLLMADLVEEMAVSLLAQEGVSTSELYRLLDDCFISTEYLRLCVKHSLLTICRCWHAHLLGRCLCNPGQPALPLR
eukprot:g16238.t1